MVITNRILFLVCFLTFAFVLAVPGLCGAAGNDTTLSLLAINVRKADCLLLRSGNTAYLIDTGTKDSVDQVLSVLASEGVTHLDGIILTHTHSDHAGGLKGILSSGLSVDRLYASAYYDKKEGKHPFDKLQKKKNAELGHYETVWLSSGDSLPLDGGALAVLGPTAPSDVENNNSLVLLAFGGGGTMLLTGDMEFPEESALISAGLLSKVDVLKIGNHGEEDATGPDLIRTCQPTVAVISTNSDDEPDTPHKRVMNLLKQWQVKVFQTQDTKKGVMVTLENGQVYVEMK